MKKIVLFLSVFLTSLVALGQQITGTVRDLNGKQLAGITVRNTSTSKSTQTDEQGNFKISGKTGDILEANSVGYERTRQVVPSSGKVTFTMPETLSSLDEAVVIGYQTTSRKKATAAISSISGKDLENLPAASFDMLLQGRLAGVNVQNFSGAPGASPTLSVRGTSAVNLNYSSDDYYKVVSNPLYVIDGVPQPTEQFVSPNTGTGTNYLAGLNPNDIESVDVLRDASAAAIYGSRAANGVVMITTKKGRNGDPRFMISGYSGLTQRPELREVTLGRTERQQKLNILKNQLSDNDYRYLPILLTDSLNPAFNGNTDWQDLFYQKGKINSADLSVSGGSSISSYRFSGNYYDEQGIIKATGFKRYTGRLNLTSKAINERLTINPIVAYSYNKRARGTGSDVSPIALSAGSMPTSLISLSQAKRDFMLGTYDDNLDNNESSNLNANLNLIFNIAPGLTFTSQSAYIKDMANRQYNRPSA